VLDNCVERRWRCRKDHKIVSEKDDNQVLREAEGYDSAEWEYELPKPDMYEM
jgi:hypothetical protein